MNTTVDIRKITENNWWNAIEINRSTDGDKIRSVIHSLITPPISEEFSIFGRDAGGSLYPVREIDFDILSDIYPQTTFLVDI